MTARNTYLMRTYGITQADYEVLVAYQCGRCAVCWKVPKTPLVIDHDHKTGIIRGLLCRMCNYKVIGRHRDASLFQAAADYLLTPPAVFAFGERVVPAKPKRRGNKKAPKIVEEK